jgi:energy-coupling factor transport system permease protein
MNTAAPAPALPRTTGRTGPEHPDASGHGWLTGINPAVKLGTVLLPLLAVIFVRDVQTPAIVAACACLAVMSGHRATARAPLGALAVLVVGAWSTFLFGAMVRPDLAPGRMVINVGHLHVSDSALTIGLATTMRLLAIMALALLGSVGTTASGLASALVHQCRVPYRYAIGTLTTLRFLPAYRETLAALRTAHRARGVIDPPGPIGVARRTVRTFIPLLAGGIRHAERLSLAMDARGFGAHPTRTDRSPTRVRSRDWVFVFGVLGGFAAIFAATASMGWLELVADMNSV